MIQTVRRSKIWNEESGQRGNKRRKEQCRVHFNQSFSTNPATKLIFAASVTDGTHTIFFIFSDQVTQQIIMTYSTNITVIIPTQKSEWNAIILSPQSIWNARGWVIPPQATLTLFLESEIPGVYYVNITSVSPV